MKIGPYDLDRDVLVIAEIGNNHEGDVTLAEELIGLAARAGANAVKFQTIVPEHLVSPSQEARLAQLRRFQLTYADFEHLAAVARAANVLFLSTPFDLDSARFLEPLVPAFKIASADNNFFPLLQYVASTGKPVLLSTGMAALEDIRRSVTFLEHVWREAGTDPQLVLLHCVASYPTQPQEANLLSISALKTLGHTVGYSDHTLGVEAAVLAVALGARVIEKHFTIAHDRSEFRDHQLSADPTELAELVARVRIATQLLGDGVRARAETEAQVATLARRSIAAGRDIQPGTIVAYEDLTWLRPAGGLAPGREAEVVGRKVNRFLSRGEFIRVEDLAAE